MSIIIERRTVCDMDHDEETRPYQGLYQAMGACLRCGKDICPAHCCDLTVPVAKPDRWPSERIATFCRPCADELIRVAQWDAERWNETNHAGEPVPFVEEDAS
jgi:hypothetical protein